MEFNEVIQKRRSIRAIGEAEINLDMIKELAETAALAPSCFNNQAWRFIFIYEEVSLANLKSCLSKGNSWALHAPLFIAVYSKKQDDCIIKDREYFLFDTGMATAFLQLKAIDMGLSIHAIAGFNEQEAKNVLNIPEAYTLICLLIVGKEDLKLKELLDADLLEKEELRAPRKAFNDYVSLNRVN